MKNPVKYGTHMPILMKLICITNGPVLEMGGGLYSTPYLHWACVPNERHLLTCENNPKFIDWIKMFEHEYHKIEYVTDWDTADIEHDWDIALIDHAPGERRLTDIVRIKDCVKYIVIHDSGWKDERHYHYSQAYPLFRYIYRYEQFKPHTSVLSNYVDLKTIWPS